MRMDPALERGTSDDDNPAGSGVEAQTKRPQHGACVQREQVTEPWAQQLDRVSVGARVGDQEDRVTGSRVTRLEGEPALQELAVGDCRLGIDPHPPSDSRHFGIPGAKVPGDRQRDLHAPSETRRKANPEALQQRHVGTVAYRVSRRKRTQAEVKPHDRAARRDELDRRVVGLANLEPTYLRMRDSDGTRHGPVAQARSDPRLPEVLSNSAERLTCTSPSSIRGSLARRHDHPVWATSLILRLPGIGSWWPSACRIPEAVGLREPQRAVEPSAITRPWPFLLTAERPAAHTTPAIGLLRRMDRWALQGGRCLRGRPGPLPRPRSVLDS